MVSLACPIKIISFFRITKNPWFENLETGMKIVLLVRAGNTKFNIVGKPCLTNVCLPKSYKSWGY